MFDCCPLLNLTVIAPPPHLVKVALSVQNNTDPLVFVGAVGVGVTEVLPVSHPENKMMVVQ